MIRIAIVEDNPKYRADLRNRLQGCQPLHITLISENGHDFLQKLHAMDPANRPEVVLMDVEMSEMDGITATAHAKGQFPDMQFLMLTVFADDDTLFRAIRAGASGYLLKEEPTDIICKAIREVHQGYGAMSPEIARKALNFMRQAAPKETEARQDKGTDPLSKRELEILKLVSAGYTYPKIAGVVSTL